MKVAIVYWTGTGNTQAMANAVMEGAKDAGAEVTKMSPSSFDFGMISSYDAIAFGCPAMGSEVLEESEFQPMFDSCLPELNGKKVALFGSYGWGDGEWMRSWEKTCEDAGVNLVSESVICCNAPDEAALEVCKVLGTNLA